MPFTPRGLPYPAGTDPVANGADNIRQLAQATDDLYRAGTDSLPITTVNVVASKTVTFTTPFPTGVVPVVQTQLGVTAVTSCAPLGVTAVSNTGFTISGARTTGTSAIAFSYMAVKP